MELIRRISGIRGIVGKTLNEHIVYNHSKAFSNIQPDGPILIARDTRSHGSDFSRIASDAITSTGRDVIDYKIIPTPTAQFLIDKNQFAGGIVITASHNPPEWLGLKIKGPLGASVGRDFTEAVETVSYTHLTLPTKA